MTAITIRHSQKTPMHRRWCPRATVAAYVVARPGCSWPNAWPASWVTAPWVGSISEARPDATRYLNRLVTRDVAKLRPGRVVHTVWCDGRGKVLDDGTLFRLHGDIQLAT